MAYVTYVSRETLAIVFAVSVISKVQTADAWREFQSATADLLGAGQVLGAVLASSAAVWEAATAVALTVNPLARVGAFLAVGLSLALLSVVLQGVLRRVGVDCNCFGSSGSQLDWVHVWRNVLLVAIAAVGVVGAEVAAIPSLIPSARFSVAIVVGLFMSAAVVTWEDVIFLAVGRRSSASVNSYRSKEA
jgi:hypothetical protein